MTITNAHAIISLNKNFKKTHKESVCGGMSQRK